jgi:predicted regulator of Ras-like GTPase activity (Roadblock/LC7/MglB family)
MVTTDNLAKLLNDLVDRVADAELAVVLSADGLLLAASRGVGHELGEQVASIAAGLYALALAAGRQSGAGTVRQVVVQMWKAFLFIVTTRSGAILTVRFAGHTEVADIAYEVALFAGRADCHLPGYRPPAPSQLTAG